MFNDNLLRNVLYIYNISLGIVMFVSFTISSSKIPENLQEVRATVRDIVNGYGYSHTISQQNLFYLKRIENEDIVYISVCGIFYVTRSYNFSALGLLFTYGLLLANLNF